MPLTNYNGWSGAVRGQRLAELRRAEKAGAVTTRAGACEICGQMRNTMFHAEEYGPTFEDYLASFKSLCGHCHAMVHLRYRFPNRWYQHLIDAQKGPVTFVGSCGTVFMRARSWADLPPVAPPAGTAWFNKLRTA